jgi:anti-sigma regulatory factor (Ser/Thr protein kinase)
MAELPHKIINLPNRTYQASARSEIKRFAVQAGFSTKRFSELEIVVAEITSNLVKHTGSGGTILVKIIDGEVKGLEIIVIDQGPGMEFINAMMEDGVSTTRTLGQGLGAIRRLSDEFDAYSQKGWGTVMVSRLYNAKFNSKKQLLQTGTVMVSKDNAPFCGDNYLISRKGNVAHVVVCDGLGHGEAASYASVCCLNAFPATIGNKPAEQIKEIHKEARKTRGAVMYVVHLDLNEKKMTYCGVGNIAVKVLSIGGKTKNCHSYNGIVGHSIPGSLHNNSIDWEKNDLLILHSDGLNNRWDMQKYPGILKHDRVLLAAALYKDNCRGTDDALVTVIS